VVERGTASPSSHNIPTQGLIRHGLKRKAGIYPIYNKDIATLLQIFGCRKPNPELYSCVLRYKKKTQKTRNPKCSETIARSFVFICLFDGRLCLINNASS